MLASLRSFNPRDLLAAAWEMLHGAPPAIFRARNLTPPQGQMVLPQLVYLFRIEIQRVPKASDLPSLGWMPTQPGRWMDPKTGMDRAEGLALIIERERAGIEGETFEPMFDEDDLKRPGRPVSLMPDQRESVSYGKRREERRRMRRNREGVPS